MKKYVLGMFAIAMAIGFSAFTKAPVKKTSSPSFAYWYQVNSNHRTVSTAIFDTDKTQEDLSDFDCPDSGQYECYVGSNSTLPANTLISGFAANQKVSKP